MTMKNWADAEDSLFVMKYFSLFGEVKSETPRSVNRVYGTAEFDKKIITYLLLVKD